MQNITYESIDINTLKFLYERYKDFIIPFLIVLASFLLFARVVLPSVFDLLDAYEEQKTALQALSNMEKKLSLLKSIDNSTLDSQLAIASKTLPIDKDFAGILNAISDASGKTGVSIGGFKFSVGSLSETKESETSTLNMEIVFNASAYKVADFIDRLQRTLPISEVNKISAQENLSNIKISFYYKPLARLKPDDSLPLLPVSAKGLALINEISSNFSIPQSSIFDLTPSSTLSSLPNPNPFE